MGQLFLKRVEKSQASARMQLAGRGALRFCGLSALLFGLGIVGLPATSSLTAASAYQAARYPPGSGDWLVVPGTRVGAIALGDAEGGILGLFPKSSISSYVQPGPAGRACGKIYTVGLLQDARHPGFLEVCTKGGKVVAIEADGARYHTATGIASNSSPGEVQLHYEGLKSYLFLGGHDEALNEGPLILWVSEEKGIAFSFAYPSRRDRSLLVFTMIIFQPGASFCVQGSPFPDPDRWRELPPYSLGPSDQNI